MAKQKDPKDKALKKLEKIEELWKEMNKELGELGNIEIESLKIKNSYNQDRIDHCFPRCFNMEHLKEILDTKDGEDNSQESK
jgi:hypothetical protein